MAERKLPALWLCTEDINNLGLTTGTKCGHIWGVEASQDDAPQHMMALYAPAVKTRKTCRCFRPPAFPVPMYGTCDLTKTNKRDDGSGYCSEHTEASDD